MDNISDNKTKVKTAIIYTRVSTDSQENEGTSLDTQLASCLNYCQEHDYIVTHQFKETWTGLSLERPLLDTLRQIVRSEQVNAVVVHSLDRLTRDPNHGVILRQEREKHNVELLCVTETVDSSKLGQLVQYIYDYASSLEAERLRDRMTRGTRARVFDKKLPVTYREPCGYQWDLSGEHPKLVPNDNYDTAKLIIDLSSDGKSYDYIIAELKRRGIPSPAGLPEWNKHTISQLIRNPVYAGQYHAFKTEVVTPKKRNGNSYGKSSVKRLPIEDWHYIPEIEVINPPMTLNQRALLLDQLKVRQNMAKRNARRDYLLRGMLLCMTHSGKNGKPRVFHGQPHNDKWRYTCPVGKCDTQYLDGPAMEYFVAGWIGTQLFIEPEEFYQKITSDKQKSDTTKSINTELTKLQKETESILYKISVLEDRYISVKIEIETYEILLNQYQNRRQFLTQHQDTLLQQLSDLSREEEAFDSWQSIRDKWIGYFQDKAKALKPLNSTKRPQELIDFWRDVFITLNVRVKIYPADTEVSQSQDYKGIKSWRILRQRVKLEVECDLPLITKVRKRDIKLPVHVPG